MEFTFWIYKVGISRVELEYTYCVTLGNWNVVFIWNCVFGAGFLLFFFVCLFMCSLHGKQVLSGVVGGNMFFVGLRRKFWVRSRIIYCFIFLIFWTVQSMNLCRVYCNRINLFIVRWGIESYTNFSRGRVVDIFTDFKKEGGTMFGCLFFIICSLITPPIIDRFSMVPASNLSVGR